MMSAAQEAKLDELYENFLRYGFRVSTTPPLARSEDGNTQHITFDESILRNQWPKVENQPVTPIAVKVCPVFKWLSIDNGGPDPIPQLNDVEVSDSVRVVYDISVEMTYTDGSVTCLTGQTCCASQWWCVDGVVTEQGSYSAKPQGAYVLGPYATEAEADYVCPDPAPGYTKECTGITSGTASSGGTGGRTVTATTAIFTPAMVGMTITDGFTPTTITEFVSPTVVTVLVAPSPAWAATGISVKCTIPLPAGVVVNFLKKGKGGVANFIPNSYVLPWDTVKFTASIITPPGISGVTTLPFPAAGGATLYLYVDCDKVKLELGGALQTICDGSQQYPNLEVALSPPWICTACSTSTLNFEKPYIPCLPIIGGQFKLGEPVAKVTFDCPEGSPLNLIAPWGPATFDITLSAWSP